RVTGLEDLFAIGVAERQPAAYDVSPVRALTAIVREPFHQRCRVDVLVKGREIHRIALDLIGSIGHRPELAALRRALLRNLRHDRPPWLDVRATLRAPRRPRMGQLPHLPTVTRASNCSSAHCPRTMAK